ncbi:MAG: PleD family two-component system response regulator [bacterium]
MKILVAEDDAVSRRLLEAILQGWKFETVAVSNGNDAWKLMQNKNAPKLAILDWMMPGMNGTQICQKARQNAKLSSIYIILLTARYSNEDIVSGLKAGADDYVVKPFNREELHARLQVGMRILRLQDDLAFRVNELEEALSRVKQLQGLLPICSYCKKIRDDKNYWFQVEAYISQYTDAQFSHSICPDCYERHVKPELDDE